MERSKMNATKKNITHARKTVQNAKRQNQAHPCQTMKLLSAPGVAFNVSHRRRWQSGGAQVGLI
jgi:hypothetical protein